MPIIITTGAEPAVTAKPGHYEMEHLGGGTQKPGWKQPVDARARSPSCSSCPGRTRSTSRRTRQIRRQRSSWRRRRRCERLLRPPRSNLLASSNRLLASSNRRCYIRQ
jgi:hypothetical protein